MQIAESPRISVSQILVRSVVRRREWRQPISRESMVQNGTNRVAIIIVKVREWQRSDGTARQAARHPGYIYYWWVSRRGIGTVARGRKAVE